VFAGERRAASSAPALLWLHGGGFVMGSVDDTESVIPSAELAARADAVVVSAGYRLAVDGVTYPVPLDDAFAAWRWLEENAGTLGADRDRLFIGGASAGANLAAGVCVRLREQGGRMPRGMLLGYPFAHFPVPPLPGDLARDLEAIPAMLRFPLEYQLGVVHNYVGRTDDLPPETVPGDHPVDGLPEAWIAPAEYDDLRSSAELLAEQLEAAGVPAHLQPARGMVHGFLGRGPSLTGVDETLDFFAGALRG
jgi:acetyl esterase/lipase